MIRLDNRRLLSGSAAVLLSIFVLSAASAQPQPAARKMSLSECVKYAIQHNVSLRNSLVDELIANEIVRENLSIGLPQINGNAQVNILPQVPLFAVPRSISDPTATGFSFQRFQPYNNANIGIQLDQLIFDGRYFLGLRAAKVYVELARKGTRRTEVETIAMVSKAYYSVQVNERRIELITANLESLKKLVSDTKAAAEQGLADNVDYQRTQVSLTNLETDLETSRSLVQLSTNLLKFQMGYPVNEAIALADSIPSGFTGEALESGLTEDLDPNARPEFQALKVQQRLNEIDLRRYRFNAYPTLRASYSLGSATLNDNFSRMFQSNAFWFAQSQVSFTLSVPIFSSFQRKSQVEQARYRLLKSKNDEDALLNSFNLELANARTSFANALRTLESQKRNTDLANEVYRVAQVKYQQGVGSSLEVVQAESEYKAAQNNYINSLLDVLTARVDLKKALGSLGESSY
jgi:outer membrane protein